MVDQEAIAKAIKAILKTGQRPTVRSVHGWMVQHYETAPSFSDITPMLRSWKNEQRANRSVTKLLATYNHLDAEMRQAFLDLAGLQQRPMSGRLAKLEQLYKGATADDRRRLRREIKRIRPSS